MTLHFGAPILLDMSRAWQSRYLQHVQSVTGRKLSAIAKAAGMSTTTLTRPANSNDHKYQMKLETLERVQKETGIPFAPFREGTDDDLIEIVEPGAEAPNGSSLVPIFDVTASAGPGAFVDTYEPVAASLALPPGYLRRITRARLDDLAIISVKGDSMLPTLKDDDLVMLDRSKTSTAYDGLFVLRFRDALHVKRLSRGSRADTVLVISDNKANYPPVEFPASEVEVVGKVLWVAGKV